jgi:hypothetical protein
MAGTIEIESEVGKGTTFTVISPLAYEAELLGFYFEDRIWADETLGSLRYKAAIVM